MQSFPKCQVEESLGVRWGLILCSLVFLIFSLMLVTEINFLLWIGICFPIDMHSFLVAISKGWCSNITVFVKKNYFPGYAQGGPHISLLFKCN